MTAPAIPAAAAVVGVAAPGPDQFGTADAFIRADDATFSAAFGLDAIINPAAPAPAEPAAPSAPAAAPAAAPVPATRGPARDEATGQFAAIPAPDASTGTATIAAANEKAVHDAVFGDAAQEAPPAPAAAAGDTNAAAEGESAAGDAAAADGQGEGAAAEGEGAAGAEVPWKPMTAFAVTQGGEAVDLPEVKDIKIKFSANGGKEYDLPIDHVVRMAQYGVYNAEKEQQFQTIAERNKALEPAAELAFRRAAEVEQALEIVLRGDEASDAFLVSARTAYAKENSPTAQIARLKAENETLKRDGAPAAAAPAVRPELGFANQVATSVGQLGQQYPALGAAGVMQEFEKLAAPYMTPAGTIDPKHLSTVAALAASALPQVVEARAAAAASSAAPADSEQVKELRGKLRLSKREANAATKPLPTAGTATAGRQAPAAPALPATATVEERMDAALQAIVTDSIAGR